MRERVSDLRRSWLELAPVRILLMTWVAPARSRDGCLGCTVPASRAAFSSRSRFLLGGTVDEHASWRHGGNAIRGG